MTASFATPQRSRQRMEPHTHKMPLIPQQIFNEAGWKAPELRLRPCAQALRKAQRPG